MNMLTQIIERQTRRREADAKRFSELDRDECMLCDAYGADKRSLFIDCGYTIDEVIPEIIALHSVEPPPWRGKGFYLLLCKSCRGRLLEMLQDWANDCRSLRGIPKDHDGYIDEDNPDRNVPVRMHGMTKMLTREEYEAFRGRLDEADRLP